MLYCVLALIPDDISDHVCSYHGIVILYRGIAGAKAVPVVDLSNETSEAVTDGKGKKS